METDDKNYETEDSPESPESPESPGNVLICLGIIIIPVGIIAGLFVGLATDQIIVGLSGLSSIVVGLLLISLGKLINIVARIEMEMTVQLSVLREISNNISKNAGNKTSNDSNT